MNPDELGVLVKKIGADTIRKALRKFRKELKLSQGDLASLAGLGQEAISRFEQGKRNLSLDALTRVHNAIFRALAEKQSAIATAANEMQSAERLMDRYVQSIDQARAKHPDFDEKLADLSKSSMVPPRNLEPEKLKGWKTAQAKQYLENRKRIGEWYASADGQKALKETFREVSNLEDENALQQKQIEALRGEVAAQAEQIAALRDLLDLKTKEVLLRDEIESRDREVLGNSTVQGSIEKKETTPKDGDD